MTTLVNRNSIVKKAVQPIRALAVALVAAVGVAQGGPFETVPTPGIAEQGWVLGQEPDAADNPMTPAKAELGKALFFDPRLSGNGTVSCASCHNPALGWSDGLKTGVGINGTVLGRATPTIVNMAYNTQFMWDGRNKSLEDQALGPMKTPEEMKTDFSAAVGLLGSVEGYVAMFNKAFPGEPIGEETIAKAIAAFERTVVSKDSRFDRWVAGDRKAITAEGAAGLIVAGTFGYLPWAEIVIYAARGGVVRRRLFHRQADERFGVGENFAARAASARRCRSADASRRRTGRVRAQRSPEFVRRSRRCRSFVYRRGDGVLRRALRASAGVMKRRTNRIRRTMVFDMMIA